MEFDLNEWLHIITRWVHVFAGILWIGTTYFFTWLDGRFHEMADSGKENSDESKVWMVHSGGFYVVGKQTKPARIATKLHWFKWEAAITWLSGMVLLVLVYYTGGLLVDAMYDETTSILIGFGSLVVAWFVYDFLWNSPLGSNERLGVIISFILAVVAIYGFSKLYGGRTAYIQAGAMFGTLMTANVWIRILPGQRKMVAALQNGEQPDLTLAARAKMRSKHNTFMIVPVVFIMISNHYPVGTYSSDGNWVVLSAVVFIGWVAAKFLRRA